MACPHNPKCRDRDLSGPGAKVRRLEANPNDNGNEVMIIKEGPSLKNQLPPVEFMEEWKQWPVYHGRLIEFMKRMLATGTLADVTFRLKTKNGTEEKVKAHKCILKRKSKVFTAMFSDPWEQQEDIDLTATGFNAADFKTFLEHCYTEEANLTNDNVLIIYYITNMYLDKCDLTEKCEVFLTDKIDEESVFTLFNALFLHENRNSRIFTRIIEFICNAGEPMLDRSELKLMDLPGLSAIFTHKKFDCKPEKLVRFCLSWIKYRGGREALEDFKEIDRRMKNDFKVTERNGGSSFPKLSDMITSNETQSLDPRQLYKFSRFGSVNSKPWVYRRNRTDRISFRVSEPIIITALGFYGDVSWKHQPDWKGPQGTSAPEPAKYNLDISIYVHGKQHREFLSLFRRAGSEMKPDENTFKVDVDPCFIHSDTWYTIAVKIEGQPSYRGNNGFHARIVKCGNLPLVFEFQEACQTDPNEKLANPTGVPVGQLPEIYFKIATDGNDDDVVVL